MDKKENMILCFKANAGYIIDPYNGVGIPKEILKEQAVFWEHPKEIQEAALSIFKCALIEAESKIGEGYTFKDVLEIYKKYLFSLTNQSIVIIALLNKLFKERKND